MAREERCELVSSKLPSTASDENESCHARPDNSKVKGGVSRTADVGNASWMAELPAFQYVDPPRNLDTPNS